MLSRQDRKRTSPPRSFSHPSSTPTLTPPLMDADDSDTSSLITITPSLRETLYRYQGSRRFQSSSDDCHWPCDDPAAAYERLSFDLCGKMYANGLYWEKNEGDLERALANPEARMLDLGSGLTASWSIAMAERFPDAECVGIDLVPTELDYLPPNLSIEVYDLLDGIPYPDDYFDLIHCRQGASGMLPFFDNPKHDFLGDVVRALKPGGVLYLEENDSSNSSFRSSTSSNPYLALARERYAFRANQVDRRRVPDWILRMSARIRETEGLRDQEGGRVEEKTFAVPLGVRLGDGPPGTQLGYLHREAWFTAWALFGAGKGLDEAAIGRERELGERAIPFHDVGLYGHCVIIYAVKAG